LNLHSNKHDLGSAVLMILFEAQVKQFPVVFAQLVQLVPQGKQVLMTPLW